MLDLASRTKARLQASTSEAFGDPEIHPQSESCRGRVNPIGFRSCMTRKKRCAETSMREANDRGYDSGRHARDDRRARGAIVGWDTSAQQLLDTIG